MKKTLRWQIAQKIELWWWQNYLKAKPETDYLLWKKRYWQGLLNQVTDVLTLAPNSRVLDAGCGPAGIFILLHQQKVQVTAIDPLLKQYEKNLAHFKPTAYPKVTFKAMPLEQLQDKQLYDTVFCMNVINHVADIKDCVQRLIEATKVGGKLVITIDAHNYVLFKKIFRLLPGDVLHPHQYDLAEYEAMFCKEGVQLLKTVHLKQEFFFDHYMLVLGKRKIINIHQ